MNILAQKNQLRNFFLKNRKNISFIKRRQAQKALLKTLRIMTKPFHCILSFYSMPDEICTQEINQHLLQQQKLALPAVIDGKIAALKMSDMKHVIAYKNVLQPDPKFYNQTTADLILVPGIAFDQRGYRLGWGAGLYDRYLSTQNVHTIGIGFKEQLYSQDLPTEIHDIAVKQVLLF